MKKIFGIALMIAVFASGMTVNAQTLQATNNFKKEKSEKCDRVGKCDQKDKKDCKDIKDKRDRKDRKEFKGNKGFAPKHQGKGQRPDLFSGIELTQDQKAQLEALKAEQKAQKQAAKKDKAKMNREDRQARRAQFTEKVKSILTPEQFAVYQQNVDKMKAKRQDNNKKNG